jgi:hypothetical protein
VTAGDIKLDERAARALSLARLDRKSVADRLAEIANLRAPTRQDTQEFLVAVLRSALRQIPSSEIAWSWGEFHNGGLQPLYDLTAKKDWVQWAVYAVELGLAEQPPARREGETLTPLDGLSRNLIAGIEQLLQEVRLRLEAAGVSPYGPAATPPASPS